MIDHNIGFIGLGNLGKNLANSVLLAGYNLFVNDLEKNKSLNLIKKGAVWCEDIKCLTSKSTLIINRTP